MSSNPAKQANVLNGTISHFFINSRRCLISDSVSRALRIIDRYIFYADISTYIPSTTISLWQNANVQSVL